jgi:hypothetical protein
MTEANRKRQPFIFAKSGSNLKLRVQLFSDGGRSSMVEPQIVVLVVAGSSPVGHPASQIPNPKLQRLSLEFGTWIYKIVSVAQPDRASDFGSEGWGFESLQARVI